MMVLESSALTVMPDEKCLWLKEEDRLAPPTFQKWHRFQQIRVMRGDWPSTYEWDMGPRSMYRRAALFVPTGIAHLKNGDRVASDENVPWEQVRRYEPLYRVGNVMDIADELRAEAPNEDLLPPPRDLIQEYVDRAEEIEKWRTYRSTFGPGGALVRN
jgi:hypothetical protein